MIDLREFIRKLLCRHSYQYDRLVATEWGTLIQAKCTRCGRLSCSRTLLEI